MSDIFLDLGFNWTWSKLTPYILFLLVGLGIFLLFKSKFRSKWVKILFSLIIVAPVAIYFAVNPIYEGDFSNDFRKVQKSESFNLNANELTVLAIPNCPYCAGSIERLNKIADRTEVDRINFIVITNDSSALESYKELANDQVIISLVPDFEKFGELTRGRFPTFVYSDKSNLRIWSNDGFGVRATDWVESEITKS